MEYDIEPADLVSIDIVGKYILAAVHADDVKKVVGIVHVGVELENCPETWIMATRCWRTGNEDNIDI